MGRPTPRHIFITGATGCVGHYVVAHLLAHTTDVLHLLVRDPARMRLALPEERVRWHRGDLTDVPAFAPALAEMDGVVHLATAWGEAIAYDVNVEATLALARAVDPARCRSFLYFSTASILDADNRPMAACDTDGTDYIRSKYLAYQRLAAAPERERVTALFPTLVFGGGDAQPTSHLTSGLDGIVRYLWALRWFTLDGSLHYIHAADIARVVAHLLDQPAPGQDFVLGNAAHSVDEVLDAFCSYYALPRGKGLDLTPLSGMIETLAGSRMNSWDRFCLKQRHFRYACVNPRSFGLAPGYERLSDILYERDPRAARGYPAPEPAV